MKTKVLTLFLLLVFPTLSYSQGGWTAQNSGVTNDLKAVWVIDHNRVHVVGNGTALRTTNGGINWLAAVVPSYTNSDVFFLDSSNGFFSGFFKPGFIRKTSNGGINWEGMVILPASELYISFINSSVGFVAGYGISKTTNGGNNWITVNSSSTNYKDIQFIDENTGYACSQSGLFAKTTNSGDNWMTTIMPSSGFRGLYFINASTGWMVNTSNEVYKTTDSGANWNMIYNTGLCGLYCVYFANESTGWVAGCEGALYKTTNGGSNFTLQSFGGTTYWYDIMFANPTTGWVVGAGGKILKTTNSGLTFINQISNETPSSFSLYQNYPNPFNPSTNIKFQIPELTNVKLTIYDAVGKEIQSLLNEELASGLYEIPFNAKTHPSGIYFYKINAGMFTQTKRMVLIK